MIKNSREALQFSNVCGKWSSNMKTQPGFDPAKTIGMALHKSSYLFKTALKAAFIENGFDATPEEFISLVFISSDGIDQGDLIRQLQKDKTNVTRLLSRMEKKQWITRDIHPESGRQQRIVITSLGLNTRQKLLPLVQQVAKRALEGIDSKDVDTAQRTLEKMGANLSSG